MGFLSKIVKGVKNIFKGVGKVVKKVWKGVKKFAKSKIGKVVIAAALIYAGGAAIGAWGGSAGTTAATTATELASSTIPAAATTATETAAALEGAGSIAGGMSTAAETAAALEGATAAATPGLVSQVGSAVTGAGKWMAANPMATMVGGQMLSAATTPSEAETYAEMEAERRKNSNIAGVSGTGEGSPISLGLIQQAQQQDLSAPTYQYTPTGG